MDITPTNHEKHHGASDKSGCIQYKGQRQATQWNQECFSGIFIHTKLIYVWLRHLKLCGNLPTIGTIYVFVCRQHIIFRYGDCRRILQKKTKGRQISTDCLPHYPSIKAKRKHVVLILHLSYKKETVLVNSLNLKVTHDTLSLVIWVCGPLL